MRWIVDVFFLRLRKCSARDEGCIRPLGGISKCGIVISIYLCAADAVAAAAVRDERFGRVDSVISAYIARIS